MSNNCEMFFPAHADPSDWEFVLTEFPFPLAITCARLQAEMGRQEPVAAAWALRDAFECLLKFSASLALADFLQARPDATAAGEIAEVLLKPSGLSLGDWHTLLEMALKPLAGNQEFAASSRVLPALVSVFFEKQVRPRPTGLNRKIDGSPDSFVAWRNRVFGHGVFSQDRGYYAQETLSWLPTLNDFYAALSPVLAGRRLVSRTPGGDEIIWQGAGELPPVPRHEHEPWSDPLPMLLAPAPGYELPSLPLTPLLSMQQCRFCGHPAAFFFDKNKYDRKQDRHSTAFLEYFHGHPGTHKNWAEAQRLAALLPPTFRWDRTNYDGEEMDGGLGIVFRDFDTEYLRPDYLLYAAWDITNTQAKGYIHLTGPGGGGKTYFVRGLAADGKERGDAVLAYHILPGARTDYRTFLPELNTYARDTLRFRTQEPQMRADTAAGMQAEFAAYLAELMRANHLDLLVVAVDALDELADPADGAFGLTDVLPPAADLPEGCFLVLTSRDDLRPKVRADVKRLRHAAPGEFTRLTLSAGDSGNRGLLRAYLTKHLPTALQTPDAVEAVLERSDGVFLYAFHLCRALAAGVFPGVAALPDGAQFYPAYLERLCARVGDHLYETVYLPTLLLLCAAQQPVTLDQLSHWGVPRDRLQFALLDLRDFLRVVRELPWQDRLTEPDGENRYEIAHEAFAHYVQHDLVLAAGLRAAHGAIARYARAVHGDTWSDADPADPAILYDLRFALPHLERAGLATETEALRSNTHYAAACSSAGGDAHHATRFFVAIALYYLGIQIYSLCSLREAGHPDLAYRLASVLNSNGGVLGKLGRLVEALSCNEEAIAIWRPLVAAGRTELAADLAFALNNKGSVLGSLGRLVEALSCNEEAIATWRPIVAAGHTELAADLARVVSNRDLILGTLGYLEEASSCKEEVIVTQRALVEAGRTELAVDLALGLKNSGVALRKQGRLLEALACYEEAAAILQALVVAGRTELAVDLGSVLDHKGNALGDLGRLPEALHCFAESIAIRRPLVAAGRTELANQLAYVLNNRGRVLKDLRRVPDALSCLETSIAILQPLVEAGRTDLTGRLASVLNTNDKTLKACLETPFIVPSELQISVSLYEAADGGDLARLTSMLAEHVELVHRRDDDGWTALHWAARFGREEAARLLIEHGADVNAVQEKSGETDSEDELRQKEKDGRTPLHSAVYSGNIAIVRLLLEHRSDWNLMDRYGRRPQDVTGDAAIKKLFSEEGRKITGES